MKQQIANELDRLKTYARQRGDNAALALAADTIVKLRLGEGTDRVCVYCGCTDSFACPGGCSWDIVHTATPTGVCSNCLTRELRIRAPLPELKAAIPLVLYLPTDADADELIAAFLAAKPNARAVKLK